MEDEIFAEHYRVCTNADGSPHEVSRSGAAINYKAVDLRSDEPVALQLVPVANIDPSSLEQFQERARAAQKLDHVNIAKIFAVLAEEEYIALVSEYVGGETTDHWVVSHGPMTPDSVLRIAIQVVRALGAAAFFSLTHRALQPSNIMIAPGQTDDGGWPFVKLLNFGLAGLESHSEGTAASELAPAIAPQFASPEQLQNRALDFRSEIYSLGATMCFLLTGAVPLALRSGEKSGFRARRLPELGRAPKALRILLGHMLEENPELRPQDPVLFEQEIRRCLLKIERRQAIRRRLGIPVTTVIPSPVQQTTPLPPAPGRQIFYGTAVFVALLIAAAAIAALFLPKGTIPFGRTKRAPDEIGTVVGVPQAPATITSAEVTAAHPNQTESRPISDQATNSPPAPSASAINSPAQVASSSSIAREAEAEPPAEQPDEASPSQRNPSDQQESRPSGSNATTSTARKDVASNSKRASRTQHAHPAESARRTSDRGRTHSVHARFLGTTADGRMILRLPSGRVVVVTPGAPDEDIDFRGRRRMIDRPETYMPQPEPFYPPGYFPYD